MSQSSHDAATRTFRIVLATHLVFRLEFDTTRLPDGAHVITAVVRDHAGNVATSDGVTVTIDN